MHSSGHVDWLAVTYPATVSPKFMLPRAVSQSTWVKQGRGAHGYRHRLANDLGAQLLSGGQERQGVHLILTGQTLENIRRTGVSDHVLLEHAVSNDGRVARLDVAINLFEANLTPQEVAFSFQNGALKTPAHSGIMIRGVKRPDETFLLGSRTSDRYLRCYDKAAEQGIPETRWLRVELELKRRRANGLAHVLAAEDNTRQVINRAIGDYLQMPDNDELTEALSEQTGEIPQEGRKIHNTFKWLIEQVAPALARYQVEHPEEDVLPEFTNAVNIELGKRQPGEKA